MTKYRKTAIMLVLALILGLIPSAAFGETGTSGAAAATSAVGGMVDSVKLDVQQAEETELGITGSSVSTAVQVNSDGSKDGQAAADSKGKADAVPGAAVAEGAPAGPNLAIDAKAAVLIDADTGQILYEQNAHDRLPPASVTKVMTMLLVLEAIDRGQVSLADKVTISERAASMGGSQMFMEAGEQQPLENLLKGIAICSANADCNKPTRGRALKNHNFK